MLKERTIALATLTNLICGMGLTALIVFLPVLFQGVAGTEATESGALLIPLGLATALTTVVAGRVVERYGGPQGRTGTRNGHHDVCVRAAEHHRRRHERALRRRRRTARRVSGSVVSCRRCCTSCSARFRRRTSASSPRRSCSVACRAVRSASRSSERSSTTVSPSSCTTNRESISRECGAIQSLSASSVGAARDIVSEALAGALASGFRVFVVVMALGLVTVLVQRAAELRARLRPSFVGLDLTDHGAGRAAVPR